MSKIKGIQMIKGGAGQWKYYTPLTAEIKWFKNIFSTVIYEEGWDIYTRTHCYAVEPHFSLSNELKKERYKKAFKDAKAYGWKLNSRGEILSFDIDKLTRNKHLITGTDLGLL